MAETSDPIRPDDAFRLAADRAEDARDRVLGLHSFLNEVSRNLLQCRKQSGHLRSDFPFAPIGNMRAEDWPSATSIVELVSEYVAAMTQMEACHAAMSEKDRKRFVPPKMI